MIFYISLGEGLSVGTLAAGLSRGLENVSGRWLGLGHGLPDLVHIVVAQQAKHLCFCFIIFKKKATDQRSTSTI
jgi:hypothetical protein